MTSQDADNNSTVYGVLFLLVILVLLLFCLYKWLNHKTSDQYTIEKIVYNEGGLRDRVMQGIEVVQSRLHGFLRPHQTHEDDERCVEGGNYQQGEDAEQVHEEIETRSKDKDDLSNNHSSTDLKEGVRQNIMNEEEKKQDEQEKVKTQQEDESNLEGDIKDEERVGLLVDLNKFSGSAIWSEEEKNENSNVTAL